MEETTSCGDPLYTVQGKRQGQGDVIFKGSYIVLCSKRLIKINTELLLLALPAYITTFTSHCWT